jgi:hypothetical protein
MSGSYEKDARWAAQRGARVTTQPVDRYDEYDVPPTQNTRADSFEHMHPGDYAQEEPQFAPARSGKRAPGFS